MDEKGYVLISFFSARYGYNGLLEKIRKEDFSRFKDSAYMDYTGMDYESFSYKGAGQHRDSQIKKTFDLIKNTPFGNTHSNSPASKNSEIEVEVSFLFSSNLESSSGYFRLVSHDKQRLRSSFHFGSNRSTSH